MLMTHCNQMLSLICAFLADESYDTFSSKTSSAAAAVAAAAAAAAAAMGFICVKLQRYSMICSALPLLLI